MKLVLQEKVAGFDHVIISVDKDGNMSRGCEMMKAACKTAMDNKLFNGEPSEVYPVFVEGRGRTAIFVGIGNNADTATKAKAFAKGIKTAKKAKAKSAIAAIDAADEKEAAIVAQTLLLANYEFDNYQQEKQVVFEEIGVVETNTVNRASVKEGTLMAEATNLARELVNEPANVLTPPVLAEKAAEAGEKYGFKVQVFGLKEIEKLKMDAFLSVAKGSKDEPKLIVMHYNTDNSKPKIALVGKGLTYDSGGFSLKPSDGMETMKSDMGGAAAVIGAMSALAKSDVKANVVGVIATCENILSSKAYKPGDIIGSMLGKTIEVGNTDAEGRLTLADAVTYSVKEQGAETVVDIATLTGAAIRALGTSYSAVVTKEDNLYEALQQAAAFSNDKVWHMPADKEFFETMKSKVADISNMGTSMYAGMITGGLFVKAFTMDKPFLHIDIAGPSWTKEGNDICPSGGTGVGGAMLYQLVKQLNQ